MSELQDIFLISAIFLGLGVVALYLAGKLRSSIFVIYGMLVGSGIMAIILGANYFLLNAILFGLGFMVYGAYVLLIQLNSCINELKKSKEEEKK